MTYRDGKQWAERLENLLVFPFSVEREYVDHNEPYSDPKMAPFGEGRVMKAIKIELYDDNFGVIMKVRSGRKVGHAPLCQLKVTSKSDSNWAHIEDYLAWYSDRF